MRLSPLLTALVALAAFLIVGAAGVQLLQPRRPLLVEAGFSLTTITPNANGKDDVTTIHYTLSRNAKVTITLTSPTNRFVFRNAEERAADTYQVVFSGVVDGYTLPGEDNFGGTVETRLIPNGDYEWTIEAVTDNGDSAKTTGKLTVANADQALPLIKDFSISPAIFTPNQDGIDDRVNANIFLTKAAALTVYMEASDKHRYYIEERVEGRQPGEAGAHFYDYDGGVDNNIPPPPDGSYTVVAVAEDKVGQRVHRMSTLTLKDGGLPNAEIAPQGTGTTVTYTTLPYKESFFTDATTPGEQVARPQGVTSTQARITLNQGDLLVFKLTVSNYGSTPLRTIGPWPGTVYQYDQKKEAMNADFISGAWRVGLECERTETTFPWRWAIGSPDSLTKVEQNGQTFWYLMPGKQAEVWGAVRITRLTPTRNPQECWAALVHEDKEVPPLQSHVGPIKIEILPQGSK